MKFLILLTAAAVLAVGCEKAEEKPAPPIVSPKSDAKRRPIASPPQPFETVSAKPAAPLPSSAELDAYFEELEALAKQVDSLEQPATAGSTPPDIDDLQKTYGTLLKRRTELMSGMTLEQKKELAKRFIPSMKRIGPALMKHRLAKAKERLKGAPAPPPTPGNVPEQLLEELPATQDPSALQAPSDAPPAPVDAQPEPR